MRVIFFGFLLLIFPLKAQVFKAYQFGWSTGISIQFGTQINGIGIHFNSYFTDRFYQLNFGEHLVYQLTDIGSRKYFFQSRTSTGLALLLGKQTNQIEFQLNSLMHNTKYNYGLAYNYLWYHDNTSTTQRSGGWAIHLKKTSILFENDIFGGQGKDRFRTGQLAITYRDSLWKFSAGFSIWTGETSGTDWQKIAFDGCPNGYRSLEDKPFGRTSHGIAYIGFDYGYGSSQWLGYKIGIDSERLRHQVQNRLLHDLIWLPKKLPRHTPHYPMLDQNGCPVFDKNDARKNVLYFQGGINSNWSY
jgi:hypothetical protein